MENFEVVAVGNDSGDDGTVAREPCGCVEEIYYLKLQGQMKE